MPVGRVVYTPAGALPCCRSTSASTRTSRWCCGPRRARAARAVDGAVVAFEADEYDTVTHSGWSVVVTGRAAVVTDPAEQERLSRCGPESWMPVGDGVFVRIESDMVTGRRLTGS
ncbi:pyridoxamine 5'-phosphate oxidase family protein [Streptomyces tricolor]|nr:pyridoxamine 5'-phosphate oxidase family protein [Streptomyces tricolor]